MAVQGRISRKQARISIVLVVVACALVLVGVIVDLKPCMLFEVILMVAALCLLPWRCPHCGRNFKSMPQWSTYGSYHCAHCGERTAYDDEPEAPEDAQRPHGKQVR